MDDIVLYRDDDVDLDDIGRVPGRPNGTSGLTIDKEPENEPCTEEDQLFGVCEEPSPNPTTTMVPMTTEPEIPCTTELKFK